MAFKNGDWVWVINSASDVNLTSKGCSYFSLDIRKAFILREILACPRRWDVHWDKGSRFAKEEDLFASFDEALYACLKRSCLEDAVQIEF